jgi:aldehyde dehydrogenase (NAD+)
VDEDGVKTFGSSVPPRPLNPSKDQHHSYAITSELQGHAVPSIDRTLKMYIGGAQKRPDAPYARSVISPSGNIVGQVGEGNRKDIREAVEAAHKAAPGWGKRAAHNRAQIVYYIAENLELRHSEMAQRISAMTGKSIEDAKSEVDLAIQRLFHWGAYADKYGGTVQETTLYGCTTRIHEPVGVIAIACPDEYPLLGFVSLVAPAVVRANTIVIVPSEKYPLSATDLYQVFDTSDLPGGVVNIVTGSRDHLTKYLAEHQNVDVLMYIKIPTAETSQTVDR